MTSRLTLILTFVVLIGDPLAAQTRWRDRCQTPFFLQLRAGMDSNPLRLSTAATAQAAPRPLAEPGDPGGDTGNANDSGQSDTLAILRPSLSVRCAMTSKTSLGGTFAFGVERFMSTKLLNTTSRDAELRLRHRFSSVWSGEAFASYGRSNQPDVLTTSSTLNFANFREQRGGFRLSKRDARGTFFVEYSAQGRRYQRLTSLGSARQSDTLHSLALGRWWTIGSASLLGARFDYHQNQSNDPIFRYREPIASMTFGRILGKGLRVDLTPRVRWISFASRSITTDLSKKRSDVIPGIAIGLRKELSPGFAAIASYAFDKDITNEPRRRFIDHRAFLGFDITIGRSGQPLTFAADQDDHPIQAIQLANLGFVAIKRGNWNEALRFSLDAIRLDPTLPEAHTNAGVAYYKLGNRAAAIEEWKQSLALRPDEKVRSLLNKIAATP